jgi:hypothetical protein
MFTFRPRFKNDAVSFPLFVKVLQETILENVNSSGYNVMVRSSVSEPTSITDGRNVIKTYTFLKRTTENRKEKPTFKQTMIPNKKV